MWQIVLPVQSNGLLIDVRVGVCRQWREQLNKAGLPVPPPIPLTFIVDTGADSTMVDDQHMRTLGLTPRSSHKVLSSTTNGIPQDCDVYHVELTLQNLKPETWVSPTLAVHGRPLLNQSAAGMLGRDVLDLGVLRYDGPRRRFTLEFP